MEKQRYHESERTSSIRALVFVAHPDDEIFMGATIQKLSKKHVDVYIVSVTDGGAGSSTIPNQQLITLRHQEAQAAGKILGVKEYSMLDIPDGQLHYNLETVDKLALMIRKVRPQLVFTHTDKDYHNDHRHLLEMIRHGLERAKSPDFETLKQPPINNLVALYLMDPQGLKTRRGQIAQAHVVVKVSPEEMEKRLEAFRVHKSQLQDAPPEGEFDYVERSRREGIVRGVQANCIYGEGFTQLYEDYPITQRNLLQEILGFDEVFIPAA